MKNKDVMPMLNAINEMGAIEIPHLDTAIAIVENHEKLANAAKKNSEALEKVVKFTEEEKSFSETIQNSDNPLLCETDNKELADSIRSKNKKRIEFEKELLEKPFKIDLKKINKKHLQDKEGNMLTGIKLRHIAALKPIFE